MRRKLDILFYSDCEYFGGSENMISVLLNSERFLAGMAKHFLYLHNPEYHLGVQKRINNEVSKSFISIKGLVLSPTSLAIFPAPFRKYLLKITNQLLKLPRQLLAIAFLYNEIKKFSPKVIHINNGGYPGALTARCAAIAAKLAKVPTVLMVVNNQAVDYGSLDRKIDFIFDKVVTKSVTYFITGSSAAAECLSKVLKLPASKILYIWNGVAPAKPSLSSVQVKETLGLAEFSGVLFGVVAVLEHRKGHKVLLKAILELKENGVFSSKQVKFILEGTGSIALDLKEFIRLNSLEDLVSIIEYEGPIMELMSCLDVMILPSIASEDFPNVILEAMSVGKPVIASRLAGIPEQVDDELTGILISPGDVGDLKSAISRLESDRNLRISMGESGLKRYEGQFSLERAISKYDSFYKSFL
jgi:glycosyltransferase involved in cell wall biosynthesis